VKVASIDGTVRDSIRVAGRGSELAGSACRPEAGGSWRWMVQAGPRFWQVFDRAARWPTRSSTPALPGRITGDALWLTRSGRRGRSIVRIGIDPSSGDWRGTRHPALRHFNNFSVTADGRRWSSTTEPGLQPVGARTAEALKGKFVDTQRLAKASTRFAHDLTQPAIAC